MRVFLDKVYDYIIKNELIGSGDKVVVGLSGGADSVCLLIALVELSKRLGISSGGLLAVHINHMIRGDEACEDEAFAKSLCERLNVRFVSYSKDIKGLADELGCTVEEAGRIFRYECFERYISKDGYSKIAVAHNKNDLAETVLFNMARGSGLKGISGIPAKRDNIVRPLLMTTRSEIEDFLKKINQDYRTDKTNLTLDYDRNKIRHIILPTMLELNSGAIDHICQLADEVGEAYGYFSNQTELIMKNEICPMEYFRDGIRRIELDISRLRGLESNVKRQIMYEIFSKVSGAKKDITRKHIDILVDFTSSDTGKELSMPYGVMVYNSYGRLIITNESKIKDDLFINILESGEYDIPFWGKLHISIKSNEVINDIPKKLYTKLANYGKIKDNLCVRNPKPDDYIIIDAKGNKKKLSRVFIDNKVDKEVRDNWPVVACDNEIVWAIGLRFSEAYKIDDDTTDVIYLEYEGKGDEYVRKNRSID